jgi:4-amino-4-deoxy-L-arabinose transferase-like glycosyltransferase
MELALVIPAESRWFRSRLLVWAGLVVIMLVAAILRLYPVLQSPETFRSGVGPFGDSVGYHKIAFNLAHGNGFSATDFGAAIGRDDAPGAARIHEPAVTRAPLYPLFVSMIYRAGPDAALTSHDLIRANADRVRIVQCLLDALTCLCLFALCRLVYPSSASVALVAALGYALSPYHIYYSRALLTETLATFLLAVATLGLVHALRVRRLLAYAISGAAWGLLALCRPEYLPLGFLVAGYCMLARGGGRAGVGSALAMGLGLALVVSPWVARNQMIFDRPVITAGGLGYSLYLGTFEDGRSWDGWNNYPDHIFATAEDKESLVRLDQAYFSAFRRGSIDIVPIDREFFRLATLRISDDPVGTLAIWLQRAPALWFQSDIQRYRDPEASGVWLLACLVLAVIGLLRSDAEDRRRVVPLLLVLGFVAMLYFPLHVEARYSVPSIPLLIALAAQGTIVVARMLQQQLARRLPTP